MNGKEFFFSITHCLREPFAFMISAQKTKWRYILFQFFVVLCLLYMPLFVSIIRTQPAQLYERLFSEQFDGLTIQEVHGQYFYGELPESSEPSIRVFDNSVVYADSRLTITAPSELIFPAGAQSRSFQEVFGMIAVYNGYIPSFLLPILIGVCATICVLQILFYIMSASALGVYRMASSRFAFGARIKISVMGSAIPATVSSILGFLLPGVHIIVFQISCLLVIFLTSKRYDTMEKQNALSSV